MDTTQRLEAVSDTQLLHRLGKLLGQSRRSEADLVGHLGEVDARRLYAREASPSMFAFCTEVLHLSEAEAYLRIAAARASREHPALLGMLADGRLHLTGIAKLAPHLTPANRDTLLAQATHRSKRQIEELIAEIAPRPDAPAFMRKLPELRPDRALSIPHEARTSMAAAELRPDAALQPPELDADAGASFRGLGPSQRSFAPAEPPKVEPLAPARYKVQFTASARLHGKLQRLSELMRASVSGGDLATIIEDAVTEKLQRLESRRFGATKAPRRTLEGSDTAPRARQIPAAVKRAVCERDGNRCGYTDGQGRRCSARERLEFHHRHPFGMGGDHSVHNLTLRCATHNRLAAEVDYGREAITRHRRKGPLDAAPMSSP